MALHHFWMLSTVKTRSLLPVAAVALDAPWTLGQREQARGLFLYRDAAARWAIVEKRCSPLEQAPTVVLSWTAEAGLSPVDAHAQLARAARALEDDEQLVQRASQPDPLSREVEEAVFDRWGVETPLAWNHVASLTVAPGAGAPLPFRVRAVCEDYHRVHELMRTRSTMVEEHAWHIRSQFKAEEGATPLPESVAYAWASLLEAAGEAAPSVASRPHFLVEAPFAVEKFCRGLPERIRMELQTAMVWARQRAMDTPLRYTMADFVMESAQCMVAPRDARGTVGVAPA